MCHISQFRVSKINTRQDITSLLPSVCGEASVYMVLSGVGRSTGGREKGHCSGCLHITELQDMGDESTS